MLKTIIGKRITALQKSIIILMGTFIYLRGMKPKTVKDWAFGFADNEGCFLAKQTRNYPPIGLLC